jgi:hypothetical protein
MITAMRPFEFASQFAGLSIELPMLRDVSIPRPVERVVNPSSPNGLFAEYQQILPMISLVRLTKCSAIAFAPIVQMRLSAIHRIWRLLSCVVSAMTSASPISHFSELLDSVTELQCLQLRQTTNGDCRSYSDGFWD